MNVSELTQLLLTQAPWEKLVEMKPILKGWLVIGAKELPADQLAFVRPLVEKVLSIENKEQWERFVGFVAYQFTGAYDAIKNYQEA